MSIDTLLSPPKLSHEQQQIYDALRSYTGSNISLKYPKSGDCLSAFVIDDIDGDDQEEAVVFYEKNSMSAETNSLRINILDKESGNWKSVYDHAADGAELEKIVITKLGSSDRASIIVGYSLINMSEKVVSIYNYEDGRLNTTFQNNYYSVFDASDFNGDGKNELFVAVGQNASREATAAIYTLEDDGNYISSYIKLPESFSDYSKITKCTLENGMRGIFLDASVGGSIMTAVLAVDSNNILSSVYVPDEKSDETLRPPGYICRDADGDGIVEMPMPEPAPGYKDAQDSGVMYFTNFYSIGQEGLEKRYTGYMNISDGYVFLIPRGWENTTVVSYGQDEISFCRLSEDGGISPDKLFTLKTVSDMGSAEKLLKSGYSLMRKKGGRYFLININSDADDLISSSAELMFRFKFSA